MATAGPRSPVIAFPHARAGRTALRALLPLRDRLRAIRTTVALLALAGCSRGGIAGMHLPGTGPTAPAQPLRAQSCPTSTQAPHDLPGVRPEHRTAAYWIRRAAANGDPDAPLLTPQEIDDHRAGLARGLEGKPLGQYDLLAPVEPARLTEEVTGRIGQMHARLSSGELMDTAGHKLDAAALSAFTVPAGLPPLQPTLRLAIAPVQLRCGPRVEPLRSAPPGRPFDRNQCSTVKPQEPILVLARWPNGMYLARTRYALGFVAPDAPLSPPVPTELREALVHGPHATMRHDLDLQAAGAHARVPAGAHVATDTDGRRVRFATAEGFFLSEPVERARLTPTRRPLTRRAFLQEAFRRLDTPYGWGDSEGGIDCSRLVLDVFESFGIALPRHSADQAQAGSFALDLTNVSSERERLRLLDHAQERGIVVLHFPGHIMLYLGRDAAGVPMALHAFAEYLTPCPGGGETLNTVDRTGVTTLELGRGTSRRAFIERITRITVFGRDPGPSLQGLAQFRPAAPMAAPGRRCTSEGRAALFVSPQQPSAEQPVRVIATSSRPVGPAELVLIDPAGRRVVPKPHVLGGPPYSAWAAIDAPQPGSWTALLGDGSRTLGCTRFWVARRRPRPPAESGEASVWRPRRGWSRDTENLYSAFVEQLFDYPFRDDLTWPDLRTLLVAQDKNLLFDHLGRGEDAALPLRPDCADLPYFLRAYFAWKMGLPFGYRHCGGERSGRPPTCGQIQSNLVARQEPEDVAAFRRFMLLGVREGSRAVNGRTHPQDEQTDLYPVPLSREAIRPGAVFADPHGHLLVVARWVPQPPGGQGMLVGAEAQPDGTVGRRRFWRGSFLFRSETADGGAGFKWWRPLSYDRVSDQIVAAENRQIPAGRGGPAFSEQQYAGSADDFYDRVEALINPRPLDPAAAMGALLDALEESVVRRVISVDNGERFMRTSPPAIEMPGGAGIFEAEGPWEDYATPSRDMRLLIAVDAVLGFPDAVRRAPQRFDLPPGADIATVVADVRRQLESELARRTFAYTRSDGTRQPLTLRDVIDRQPGFEVGYNPNDCVEVRWAAPEGSPEHASCRRAAPPDQRARMERYRAWFHRRARPTP